MMTHGWWIAVWPRGTFLVFPDGRRVQIPTTARTLVIAYMSSWSVLLSIIFAKWAHMFWGAAWPSPIITQHDRLVGIAITIAGVALVAWAVLWRFISGIGRATPGRAEEVRAMLAAVARVVS